MVLLQTTEITKSIAYSSCRMDREILRKDTHDRFSVLIYDRSVLQHQPFLPAFVELSHTTADSTKLGKDVG